VADSIGMPTNKIMSTLASPHIGKRSIRYISR
jgi:hypothetical protein